MARGDTPRNDRGRRHDWRTFEFGFVFAVVEQKPEGSHSARGSDDLGVVRERLVLLLLSSSSSSLLSLASGVVMFDVVRK